MGSSRAGRKYAPGRRRAWRRVEGEQRSVRGGLQPQPCEVCGAAVAQAHHHDYEQPHDVVWLCQAHHSLAHKYLMRRQTDNSDLAAKIELRRELLDGRSDLLVFDACAGDGHVWQALRRDHEVRYFAVDRKRAKGRLSIDSLRLLSLPGLPYDVIDLDVYGSPWRPWFAALRNSGRSDLTVFLTTGSAGLHGSLDRDAWRALGVTHPDRVPAGFGARLSEWATPDLLGQALVLGWEVETALEGRGKRARYYGLRLRRDPCPT